MSNVMYGYVRVSTWNQKENRQPAAPKEFGIAEERITAAKKQGIRSGPEQLPMLVSLGELIENWQNGYISATEADRQLASPGKPSPAGLWSGTGTLF